MTACPTAWMHHEPGRPTGYLAFFAWAEEMARTHVLTRCPGCGLWTVWQPFLAQARDLRSRPFQARAVEETIEHLERALSWRAPGTKLCVVENQCGQVAAWLEDAA